MDRSQPRYCAVSSTAAVVCLSVLASLALTTNGFVVVKQPQPTFVSKRESPVPSMAVLGGLTQRMTRYSQLFLSPETEEVTSSGDSTTSSSEEDMNDQNDDEVEIDVVRAPLKFIGPYPCLGLRFPHLATSSQRQRNVTGISLDFLVDTAANTNTINGQVAQELQLQVVGQALPGVGSAGYIAGGETYELGDTQLEFAQVKVTTTPSEQDGHGDSSNDDAATTNEPFLFMQNLTASALPVASPSGAGLMSLAFLYSFQGGVEFNWGSPSTTTALKDGMVSNPPSIAFYGELSDTVQNILADMTRVDIEPIPVTNLPSVTVRINGVEMKALLDTGSPITVLNEKAAQLAGIDTFKINNQEDKKSSGGLFSKNPFAGMVGKFQEAKEVSQAAARGELLTIAGTTGQPVYLLKSKEAVQVTMPAASAGNVKSDEVNSDNVVTFGEGNVYVGDLPGLAALGGLGVDSPPAVVLGMDVLRSRPRMFLRASENEVYF